MREQSPLAGKTITIKTGEFAGMEYQVEDWWQNAAGMSWMVAKGNPACLKYAMRTGLSVIPIPTDNEVLYGHIGELGELIHISEV